MSAEAPTYHGERLIAIVNPAAGRGKAVRRWRDVNRRLLLLGLPVETCETECPGHATALARRAIESGTSTVIAVGGDGTIHEVVNGFWTGHGVSRSCRLAVVPAGTGVDVGRNIGYERGVEAAVNRLTQGRERNIDVGCAGNGSNRLFVNFAETGIGARVVAKEGGLRTPLPGRATFLLAALATVMEKTKYEGRVSVEGQELYRGPFVSIVIANGAFFGGGMKIAPAALVDDGLLDVVVLCDFTRSELVSQIWKIYPGVHIGHPKVRVARGRVVEIDVEGVPQLDLDGELYEQQPDKFSVPPYRQQSYKFSVLPRALRVLV